MGLYITVTYTGDWSGEDPLTETAHETTGDLFRALVGADKERPWEALGRCIGRMYIDDAATGEARQTGWVFEANVPDPDARRWFGRKAPVSRREAWVSVYTEPPTVSVTHHPAPFR